MQQCWNSIQEAIQIVPPTHPRLGLLPRKELEKKFRKIGFGQFGQYLHMGVMEIENR